MTVRAVPGSSSPCTYIGPHVHVMPRDDEIFVEPHVTNGAIEFHSIWLKSYRVTRPNWWQRRRGLSWMDKVDREIVKWQNVLERVFGDPVPDDDAAAVTSALLGRPKRQPPAVDPRLRDR